QMVTSSAQSMAFSADERLVALLGQDNMIHLCETGTGKVRHRLGKDMPRDGRMFFGNDTAAIFAFSMDGKLLASSTGAYDPETNTQDTSVRVWDVATGKELLQVETDGGNIPGRPIFYGARVPFAWSPDNRTLAVGQNKIRLWEIRTQGVRRELAGHTDAPIRALAFSPDGRALASGSADTTVLIWDTTDRNRPTSAPREPGELEKRWRALAEDDAAKAYAAIRDLAAAPDETISWIKERIKPADAIDPKHIDDLISQLDNEQFKVRQKASADLLHIGERAIAALDKALAGTPTLETSRRLQDLRKRAGGLILKGDSLQAFRAVEVLERIGTPKAREVLQILADGATGAQVTTQAREALGRLGN
ncbi:MAG TPA: hypothetical protein VNX28_09020, partial [Gemmataceae bacterium]|nr:hypothetical protein [Gemmataceae bacterium]